MSVKMVYVVAIEQPLEPGSPVHSVWETEADAIAAMKRLIAEEFDTDNGDEIEWSGDKYCECNSDINGRFIYTVNGCPLNTF